MRPDQEAEARRQLLRKEQRDAAVSKVINLVDFHILFWSAVAVKVPRKCFQEVHYFRISQTKWVKVEFVLQLPYLFIFQAPASPEEFRLAPEAQARQLARKKEEKAQLLATRTSPDTFVPERTSPVNRENMLQPTKLDFTPIQIRTITRNDENITEVSNSHCILSDLLPLTSQHLPHMF